MKRLILLSAIFLFVGNGFAGGTMDPALLEAMNEVTLFQKLTSDEQESLYGVVSLRAGRAGDVIIHQGQPMDTMYILMEGTAEVRINGNLVATLPGRTVVGEVEFLDPAGGATASVILTEDCRVIAVDYDGLQRRLDAHPRMGYIIMGELARIEARRLRNMDK